MAFVFYDAAPSSAMGKKQEEEEALETPKSNRAKLQINSKPQ